MNNSLSLLNSQIAHLPTAARNDFHFWRNHLQPLLTLRRGVKARLIELSRTIDVPYRTLHNKLYAAKKDGVTVWIDKRLAGPRWWRTKNQTAISDADKELVKFYCEKNQRSSRSAVKQMRRDWTRGRIKTETPKDPRTGFPRGWSIDNLDRYAPTKFELKAVRIGRSAAASERPLVYTTRKGLHVGSHYMLDDMWHDFFINSFEEHQAGRPLELFSHDLFSARKVRWGIRVRTRDMESRKYNHLGERMTRLILAATLFLDGYSPRGTVIVAEHGTAAVDGSTKKRKDSPVIIRDGLDKALYEMSDRSITVSRSGMIGAAAHAGQYPGLSRGNFRHKASLESANNLTHNVFAALPGQTGKDVEHRPEGLGAMLDNNRDLLLARRFLSPERAALLEFPILEQTQFHSIAHELYAAIDNDPDHELNDWVECGHVVNEVLIGETWVDVRKLPSAIAASLCEAIGEGTVATRPRKMTRGEVWRAGAGELVRIPGYGVCAILGDDLAFPRKVSSNMFEFEDREVGPGVHRYAAIAKTPHGEELRLADGEKYETFVNPFAIDTMFVRRGNGAYIGECRRIEKPCRADTDAVHRRCGEVAKTENELLQPLRARHLAEAREKARRHERNAAVLSGKPLSMPDRMQAIADKERVTTADAFLDSPEGRDSSRPLNDFGHAEACPSENEAPIRNDEGSEEETRPTASASDFL